VMDLTGLSAAGEANRDKLAAFLAQTKIDAERFMDKREVHFERQAARGLQITRLSYGELVLLSSGHASADATLFAVERHNSARTVVVADISSNN